MCACSSSGSAVQPAARKNNSEFSHWVALPQPGYLTVIGISARQSTRKKEIDIALDDAARKIAMYHGVKVTSENVESIGAGFLDYYVSSHADLEYDQQLEKYAEKLTYDPKRDVIQDDGAIFVRFAYPAVFPGAIGGVPGNKKADGSPEWTTRPPSNIGDFIAGVGHSGKQQKLRDTVLKSYGSAAAAIVSQISTSVTANYTSDSNTYHIDSSITRKSEGELRYFTVIEIWINPDNGDVWTLAVAKSAE